jgi:hypothetical protein
MDWDGGLDWDGGMDWDGGIDWEFTYFLSVSDLFLSGLSDELMLIDQIDPTFDLV